MRPRCYVASGLGFTEAGRDYYARVYLPALSEVVQVVDPWSLTSADEVAAATGPVARTALNREIAARNVAAIRSCALLAACLDGQEVDAGTAAEIGFASGLGLRCFGLRTDLRDAGEPGSVVNLQVAGFCEAIAGSLGELVELLRGG